MNQNLLVYAIDYVMTAARASGLFSNLFTALTPDGTFGDTGAPSGNYVAVSGLENIACKAAVETAIEATEVRALEEITASELHHVTLDAYYPALDDGWRGEGLNATGAWICQVQWAGVWYRFNIIGVESDSETQMTRVRIKLATV